MIGPASSSDAQVLAELQQFLRTIQKPNKPVESLGLDDRLATMGSIVALVQEARTL